MALRLKKGDVALIACVILVAGVIAVINASGDNADSAAIMVDGALWREVPLRVDSRLVFDDGSRYNVVVIENGGARMEEANCPDGLCVKQGAITENNSVIVCLPNRFAVRLSKSSPEDDIIDVIVENR